MNFRNSFHPYAMVSISGWALAHIFSRLALQYFSGVGLGFLRYFVASCVLIAVAVAYKMQPPCKKDIPWFAAAGAAGFAPQAQSAKIMHSARVRARIFFIFCTSEFISKIFCLRRVAGY